jgi:hypothetical protein
VRHLSSVPAPQVKEAEKPPHPNFWIARPSFVSAEAGANRTNWDLRYDPPPAFVHSYEINANPGLTPASPVGALAAPGTYTLKLTVDGRTYATKVVVTNDPRSPATTAAVRAQVALQLELVRAMRVAYDGYQQVAAVRTKLDSLPTTDSTSQSAKAIVALRARLDSVSGSPTDNGFNPFGSKKLPTDFASLHALFQAQFMAQENGDLAPTEPMHRAFTTTCRELATTVARWRAMNAAVVSQANAALANGGRNPLPSADPVAAPKC